MLKTGPSSTTLTYDPLTRLYQSVSGATTNRFAYDGLNALAEYNSSNVLQRRWVYEPGGQPILWYEGAGLTNRRFLSADERGSIISTSDSTGAKLAINTYDEYGNPAATNSGRYGYTGQAWLPSVTLWYYRARVYEPQLGRFLQPDPIGFARGANLYVYVRNDPINLVDPFGLQPCSGDGCPRGGIQVVGQRLTFVWWPRMTMLIIDRALDFGNGGGLGGLIDKIGKEVHSAYCKNVPHPPATIQVSGGASIAFSGLMKFITGENAVSGGYTLAMDPSGSIEGFSNSGGYPIAVGAGGSLAVTAGISNAKSVGDLAGVFAVATVTSAEVGGATAGGFAGRAPNGDHIYGSEIGLTAGAQDSIVVGLTNSIPIGGISCP